MHCLGQGGGGDDSGGDDRVTPGAAVGTQGDDDHLLAREDALWGGITDKGVQTGRSKGWFRGRDDGAMLKVHCKPWRLLWAINTAACTLRMPWHGSCLLPACLST